MGGVSVVAAPGEEIQQAVLNHLQRLAISLGAPIRTTIHDDRAGWVVSLEVSANGSSRVLGQPVRVTAVPEEPVTVEPAVLAGPSAAGAVLPAGPSTSGAAHPFTPAPAIDLPVSRVDVPPTGTEAGLHTTPPTPAGPRGFDAVAEEVLGDGPLIETVEGADLLTEPMRQICEAVRTGRIEAAADLADRTVTGATAALGLRHPEVLHLRELVAYIAYLADDPVRACGLSLDLARLRRRAWGAEVAHGNVQSAATAWRAVRDPEEGLRLGRDLIDLWTDLAAEPGPAAEDPRPLESARARMVRLADRAARARQP
ncbi:hypothetical protein LK07_13825 [Streptomyces pluripotens]|uniref:Tetratricopeptide repeat protein n=1 Tax=Streptomyces pluripotens TaxID=1355015 RepID=A0A221P8U3_9ACTN|nr:hypothetical protein LK06_012695 [Streptomyces pluripotens]ASN28398.1 hypothetical protein LK07_13825 [Streptomyces pluripotens]KIE27475.1 hypothetical protein LK08_08835 [Streptomyces sp. MUSC 125]